MIYKKFKLLIFILALALSCSITAGAAHAQAPALPLYDSDRAPWTALSFHAKNFWVLVSTDTQFISLPAAGIEVLLPPSPEGAPAKPTAPHSANKSKTENLNSMLSDARFRYDAFDSGPIDKIRPKS